MSSPPQYPAPASPAIAVSRWNREHPYPALLLSQQRLTGALSAKDVRHIELDLDDAGLFYEPGDTLGIWVRNDPALVKDILSLAGLDGSSPVQVGTRALTLAAALLGSYELTQAHAGFIKHYTEQAGIPELARIAADPHELRKFLDQRQIVDVLREFPAQLTVAGLQACLRRLTPRQYSIASSPLVQPRQVGLTVNMVRYQKDAQTRTGAASSFLGWHVHEGDRVPVFVVTNPNFRLPADADAPMIMIGPGTGIAPFRAFLQHRAASSAAGDNWLFFGNPSRNSDFLYREELQAWRDQGVLTRLDLAFSRDQPDKIYVQHRMQEQAATLFAWLERGAYLYVCGDARHMAEDVQKTLIQIIAQQGGLDSNAARGYLVKMRKEHRYQRDVY